MKILPKALKVGDTIGVVAPSNPIIDENIEEIEKARKIIEEKGFKVKYSKNLFSNTNGYSASAKEIAEDINSLFEDKEVKMIWCAKGGENSNSVFDYLDYEMIKKNPKIICGFSDITSITNIISAKTGLVTFSGTNFKTIATDETDYSLKQILNRFVDNKLELGEKEDKYVFTTEVNYPNNRTLIKQNIYLDKKLNLKEVHVLNESGNAEIKMVYNKIDKSPTFNDNYFELNKNLEAVSDVDITKQVVSIDDVIFPMYIPENTALSSQDTIAKTNGERIILTFSGDKPFVLIEETVDIKDEFEIIPTIGEPTMLVDTVGLVSSNSVSWISGGMEYYIASDVLSNEEMVMVAKSISTIPVMK